MVFHDLNQIRSLLDQVANTLVKEKGFIPEFSKEALDEAHESSTSDQGKRTDFCHLFWISIDNIDSRDLDQLSYAEEIDHSKFRLYVAIADVDDRVPFDGAIDRIARNNTTTIYTPFKIFPMIPPKLCYEDTSLIANHQRNAFVVQIIISSDGSFKLEEIHMAVVENKAKLAYPSVSDYLDEKTPLPIEHPHLSTITKQLDLQFEIAKKIEAARLKKGALTFAPMQGEAIVEEGMPIGLREKKQSSGQKLIENVMIAANVATTTYFMHAKLPIIRRVVKTPKRWNRIVELANNLNWKLPKNPDAKSLQQFLNAQRKKDPLHFPDLSLSVIKLIGRGEYILAKPGQKSIGHFDLALIDYAHTTAPNRRYPDLTMQRLLKNDLLRTDLEYQTSILSSIATNCTAKEEAASKIERHLYKSFAAFILKPQIGKEFHGIVTGCTEDATWIRLIEIPVEGKLVEGCKNVDVGDKIMAKLIHVDIEKGFIDFSKSSR
jgi:exoribonuclease-2